MSADCPHCHKPVFRATETKLKAKTSILVLHKSDGAVEINCGSCGRGVILPLRVAEGPFELKKADLPTRFVIPKTA